MLLRKNLQTPLRKKPTVLIKTVGFFILQKNRLSYLAKNRGILQTLSYISYRKSDLLYSKYRPLSTNFNILSLGGDRNGET